MNAWAINEAILPDWQYMRAARLGINNGQ